MRIGDRQFLENYRDWAAENNLIAAKHLFKGMEKESNLEMRKLLFIKLIFEYLNSGENLISLIHVVRTHKKIKGFRKALVHCNYKPRHVRELLEDLKIYENRKFEFFKEYLSLALNEGDYREDQNALDGLYKAIYAALKNRTAKTRGNRSGLLIQAYNKIKHAFPVYSVPSSSSALIYLSKGSETKSVAVTYDIESAREIYESVESVRNTIMNLIQLILEKGFQHSNSGVMLD